MSKFLALCGGVGGAKLADGLQRCLAPGELALIVNTGDDFVHRALPVWPDIDTVLYTLGGVANAQQGWGRADESWQVQAEWQRLGIDTWFQLGDRDIALHLLRREWLDDGLDPVQICARLAQRFGLHARLLPMAATPAPTTVLAASDDTATGTGEAEELEFQDYFVRRRCAPVIRGFRYGASRHSTMDPRVEAEFTDPALRGIILCPSNPYLSIAPILAVPGLRRHLVQARVPVIAVSPIIGGEALKGPAAKIMRELGVTASAVNVAREYQDFLDLLLVDADDVAGTTGSASIPTSADPVPMQAAPIVMTNAQDRLALAQHCLDVIQRRGT